MRIKILALFILPVAGFIFSLCSTAMADALQDAEQAIAKKEYSTAIIHLKNQLKDTPKNAQARFLLGGVYLNTGKLDSSLKELWRAHSISPDDTEILFRYADALQAAGKQKKILTLLYIPLNNKKQESQRLIYRGYAYLALNQLADARMAFEEALKLDESAAAYNGLATLHIVEKEYTLAEKLLTKSSTIEADNTKTLHLKAKLANLNKQHEQALLLYNQLIEQNTNNLSLYLERAATLIILKKDELAKADLKVILDKVKNHPQANFIQAQILLREHDFAGAQTLAQRVVNTAPQHIPATFILGAANFGLKHYNQAEKFLTIYLSANPSDLKAQNLLANVYLAQNKTKQALLTLEGIPKELRDASPITLLTLGSIYMSMGDTKKSIELLTRAQLLAPKSLDIRKRLIAAHFQSGELDEAISELELLSSSHQEQTQANYLLIISYIKQHQFDKAATKVNQLLIQSPDDVKLQNLDALTEYLKGDTKKAIAKYQAIIKQHKENIPAYMGLARIAAMESNWQEAERYFKQVLRIKPNALKAWIGLAAIAEKQNKPQVAEQYFLDAIEQSSANITSQLAMATLLSRWYRNKQQPEKILALAEKLKKQHANNSSVSSFLARAQLLNQQNERAERTLKSIITFDNNDVKHRILLTQIISQEPERRDEALRILEDALAIAPENLELYILKTAILINQTRYKEALSVAKDVQKKFPDSVSGKLFEADIYRIQKQYENALPVYLEVYQQKPDKKVLFASIDILLVLNQQDAAIAKLTQASDKNPQDIDILFKLASLYQKQQQFKKAEQYYEQLLKIAPHHIVSLNNLAWIYSEHNIKQAVELAKRAHEQAPESAAIMDSYGYFLVRDGHYQQGLKLLKQAAEEVPENNDIQYHLALAFEKTAQRNKALSILEVIVKSKTSFSEQENSQKLLKEINE